MSFSVVNGQIFTPGLAIIDAPQPYTPLGGDTLHVAIEGSGNGQLSLEPDDDEPTQFHEITLFLTSNEKETNLTISNGTTTDSGAYVGPILGLESGSTVKHVNWIWPDCFVGEGEGDDDSARGNYNISIHQSFRYDGDDYYTISHLPISVSNGIEESDNRTDCKWLQNEFHPAVEAASNGTLPEQPWGATGSEAVSDPNDSSGSRSRGVGVKQLAVFGMVLCGTMLF